MQPILDTATPNITKEPRMVLNPARGNRQVRGRCPRYWGMVLGLSEGAIYARRPPKGIEREIERSRRIARGIDGDRRDVDPHRRLSKVVGDPRRSSKVLEGHRRSSKVLEGARGILGMSVRARTSLALVVEVMDKGRSADGGSEGLSNSVGMTGHVVPLHHPPSRSQRPRCIGLCLNE